MEVTALCDLPEDEAITPEEFVVRTRNIVDVTAPILTQQSIQIEAAVFDIVKVRSMFYELLLETWYLSLLEAVLLKK